MMSRKIKVTVYPQDNVLTKIVKAIITDNDGISKSDTVEKLTVLGYTNPDPLANELIANLFVQGNIMQIDTFSTWAEIYEYIPMIIMQSNDNDETKKKCWLLLSNGMWI